MKIDGHNIQMVRGDSEVIEISLFDEHDKPFHLTRGDVIYFTIKTHARTTNITVQKKITDFTDGLGIINIDPEDTDDLDFKAYVYDIQLNLKNGDVKTVIPSSRFTIKEEVTYD